MSDVQKLMIDIMGPGEHVRNLSRRINKTIAEYQTDYGSYDDLEVNIEIEEVGE